MISKLDALEAAQGFYRDVDQTAVVDRLVEDDTHYGVCTIKRDPELWLVGMPILFIRKSDGALEPDGSHAGPRLAAMRELA